METVKETSKATPIKASRQMHFDVVNKGRRQQLSFSD